MKIVLISQAESVFTNFMKCLGKLGHAGHYRTPREVLSEGFYATPDLVVVADHAPFAAADFIRELRLGGHRVLVMALIESGSTANTIEAFDAGADQVTRCSACNEEITARVMAMLRYRRPSPSDRITYRDLVLEPSTMTAMRGGFILPLVGKPFALLEFFVRHPEKIHSRERIGESVWDHNFDVFSNVIDVTVSKLRKHVDNDFAVPYIQTVVGRGYMLREEIPAYDRAPLVAAV